ncbi:MAG: HAMP domain-containing sensor histidine kinase [Pseudomonadota bacterium]
MAKDRGKVIIVFIAAAVVIFLAGHCPAGQGSCFSILFASLAIGLSLFQPEDSETAEKIEKEIEKRVRLETSRLENSNRKISEAYENLKKLEKMKADLALVIYHDLRSPLAAVQSCLNVVLEGFVGELNPRQMDMLRRADEDIEKLLTFITDLLDLSQIEMSPSAQHFCPARLKELLDHIVKSNASRAERKELTVNTDIPDDLPEIYADTSKMEQVFRNIIGNAIKYTNPGGTVDIRAREEGGFIVVTVTDSGIGMSQEDLAKIFDVFYRAPGARAMEKVGTGLGLPIAKRIIDDHWGTIRVTSEEGKGSVFTVTLPPAKQGYDSHA